VNVDVWHRLLTPVEFNDAEAGSYYKSFVFPVNLRYQGLTAINAATKKMPQIAAFPKICLAV
jgi:hypothetical protein